MSIPSSAYHRIKPKIKRDFDKCVEIALHLGYNAALHPIFFSRVLIQLDYQPMAAIPSHSLTGEPILLLPNVFQYISHIKEVDGFWGLYRGLQPKLCGSLLGMLVGEKIANCLGFQKYDRRNNTSDDSSVDDRHIEFKENLKRDMVMCLTSVVVAHPFKVISVRMMAQFIGRETIYDTMLKSVKYIFKTQGLKGFYSGFVPELLYNVGTLLITSISIYYLNKYVKRDSKFRLYNDILAKLYFAFALYPLQFVSTLMILNGSNLNVGNVQFNNWIDCWIHMGTQCQLTRGRALLYRTKKNLLEMPGENDAVVTVIARHK